MKKYNTIFKVLPVLFGFFIMSFVDVVGISANYAKQDFGLRETVSNLLPFMLFLLFALLGNWKFIFPIFATITIISGMWLMIKPIHEEQVQCNSSRNVDLRRLNIGIYFVALQQNSGLKIIKTVLCQ